MNKQTITSISAAVALLVIAQGCNTVTSPDGSPSAGIQFSSPEQVFKAANHAAKKQDFNAYLDCFSEPGERRMSSYMLNLGLALDESALGWGRDSAGAVTEVVEKYKILDLYDDPDEIQDMENRREFTVELMKAISAISANPDTFTLGKITGVKVEGDTAIGKTILEDEKKAVHFVKEGDRWKIEWRLETNEPAGN